MEYILNYTLLALLEIPDATLLDVNRMLSDKQFRNKVISQLKEPTVRMYWEKEFAGYTDKVVAEATPAIQNKVGQFISNSLIRNIIGQKKSSFDIRRAMDEKKILLINLSIGRIGEDAVNLLGSLFVTKIYLAAMSRATVPDREMKHLPNFYLYVDEFQNFTNDSFAQILAQARKYKLSLIVAHQYVKQMTEVVHDAIFGNVGTMIAFRVGADDGEALEKEFQPTFVVEDFVNLGRFQMYLKLMINGVTSGAFSAKSMGVWPEPAVSHVDKIIESSRALYSHPRKDVEDHILQWTLGGGGVGQQGKQNTGQQGTRQAASAPTAMSHGAQGPQPAPQAPRDSRGAPQSHASQPSHAARPTEAQPKRDYPAHTSPRRDMPVREGQRDMLPRLQSQRTQPQSHAQTPRNDAPKVHNPFATAFKAALVDTPAVAEQKAQKATEETIVVEQPSNKKEVDSNVLKDVLGIE
jgi:hypothetical protein